jgi:amino acid transporter
MSVEPQQTDEQDSGLLHNSVGTTGVTFTSIANQAPGSAVALNMSFAVLFVGSALPLALLVAMIGTLFLANTVVQFSRHVNSANGFGGWVARAIGPRSGMVTSWTALFYGLLFPAEGCVITGQILANSLQPIGVPIPWWVYNVALLTIVTLIAYKGIRDSARVAVILGVVEIVIFLALGLALVFKSDTHNTLSVFLPSTGTFGLTWGLVWGFLSFAGFESIASLGAEAKNPTKTIGRSAYLAVFGVGIFLIFLGYAGVVGWGGMDGINDASNAFAANVSPYSELAKRVWEPFQWILLFAITSSCLMVTLAATNFAARYSFSLSREGALPKQLGHVHPRHQTPSTSILTVYVISVVLSLGLGALWGTSITFSFLATAFTFGWIFMFAFANVALPIYYRRHRPNEFSVWKHVVFPAVGTLLLVPAVISPLLPMFPAFASAGPVTPQIIATIPVTLLWIAVGVLIAVRRYRRGTGTPIPSSDSPDELVHKEPVLE